MSLFITALAVGVVALNIALVVALVALFTSAYRARLTNFVKTYAWLIVFLLSAGAVCGTLFLQFVGLLNPCVLCWWQRIFMYPVALISLIGFFKGNSFTESADYVLGLSLFGICFSFYQHLLQILPQGSLIPCDAANDCAVRTIFEFGYVTLPWMGVSVFAVLILVALVARKR